MRFLGPPSKAYNPFAPISACKSRIERFKSLFPENAERRDQKEMKLPAVKLPSFDGSDLETFLKDFERWMRLSGCLETSDKFKIDWLVEACSLKVKRLIEKFIEEKKIDQIPVLSQIEILFSRLEKY